MDMHGATPQKEEEAEGEMIHGAPLNTKEEKTQKNRWWLARKYVASLRAGPYNNKQKSHRWRAELRRLLPTQPASLQKYVTVVALAHSEDRKWLDLWKAGAGFGSIHPSSWGGNNKTLTHISQGCKLLFLVQ